MRIEAYSLKNIKEFEDHKVVHFFYNVTGLYAVVAVHKTGSDGQTCFGATRLWNYHSYNEAISDALKLSKTMSYKSVMAGLPYGGAKGVILAAPSNLNNRKLLFTSYANHLKGIDYFMTGADVGITDDDLVTMKQVNSNIIGLKANPVKFTALGIYHSIKLSLKTIFGNEEIQNRTFAIQGLGQVGLALIEIIYREAKHIYAVDIDEDKIKHAKKLFPRIEIVSVENIYKKRVDVFSPCAMGGTLNRYSINKLNCKIIIGGANNQLESKDIGLKLYEKGILYGPDYIVNAGGLIAVTDEYMYKNADQNRIDIKVTAIRDTLEMVLKKSSQANKATNIISNRIAEQRFQGQGWGRGKKTKRNISNKNIKQK